MLNIAVDRMTNQHGFSDLDDYTQMQDVAKLFQIEVQNYHEKTTLSETPKNAQ